MSQRAPLRVGSIYKNGINLSDLFLVVTCSVQSLIILTVKGQLFRLSADWIEHHCTVCVHTIHPCLSLQIQVHALTAPSASLLVLCQLNGENLQNRIPTCYCVKHNKHLLFTTGALRYESKTTCIRSSSWYVL